MIPFFLLYIKSEEENETRITPQTKYNKYTIIDYEPKSILAGGGELITVTLDRNITDPVFCKFNEKTVYGKRSDNVTINCFSPRLETAEASLSISIDKQKWSKPVRLIIHPEAVGISIFSLIGGLTFVLAIIVGLKITVFKKKPQKKRRRRIKPEQLNKAAKKKSQARRRLQAEDV